MPPDDDDASPRAVVFLKGQIIVHGFKVYLRGDEKVTDYFQYFLRVAPTKS
jgi:hypothetical protein